MTSFIKIYSDKNNEIRKFLNNFYYKDNDVLKNVKEETLELKIDYVNPIEISDIIGVFIDNNEKYKINMWLCLDKDVLINVTAHNADDIIKYLFERYPY